MNRVNQIIDVLEDAIFIMAPWFAVILAWFLSAVFLPLMCVIGIIEGSWSLIALSLIWIFMFPVTLVLTRDAFRGY